MCFLHLFTDSISGYISGQMSMVRESLRALLAQPCETQHRRFWVHSTACIAHPQNLKAESLIIMCDASMNCESFVLVTTDMTFVCEMFKCSSFNCNFEWLFFHMFRNVCDYLLDTCLLFDMLFGLPLRECTVQERFEASLLQPCKKRRERRSTHSRGKQGHDVWWCMVNNPSQKTSVDGCVCKHECLTWKQLHVTD